MLSVDVNALLISDLNCTFVSAPVIIRFSRSLLSNLKLTRELEPCVFLVKPLIERSVLKSVTIPISPAPNLLALFETSLRSDVVFYPPVLQHLFSGIQIDLEHIPM